MIYFVSDSQIKKKRTMIFSTQALFTWRKVVPRKRVTLPAESISHEQKVDPFNRANCAFACLLVYNSARPAYSACLVLTELTRLGEPKCLVLKSPWILRGHGWKEAQLGGWLYHQKRVTLLAAPTFCFSCRRFAGFYKEIMARPGKFG